VYLRIYEQEHEKVHKHIPKSQVTPQKVRNIEKYTLNSFEIQFTTTALIGVRARGLGGISAPLTQAKPSFFGQKLNFSGRSQQPKMKNYFFLYLLN